MEFEFYIYIYICNTMLYNTPFSNLTILLQTTTRIFKTIQIVVLEISEVHSKAFARRWQTDVRTHTTAQSINGHLQSKTE